MKTMSNSHKTIKDINIKVDNPDRYLRTLWAAINESCSEMKDVLTEIEKELGHAPRGDKSVKLNPSDESFNKTGVIGYYEQPLLISIADREWVDSEYNEFNDLASYLGSKPLFSSASSVYICGAGVCRLGDYVSSLENIKSVYCSDLSWLGLYIGRMLIQREYHKLPALFHVPRLFYNVSSDFSAVSAKSLSAKFQPPSGVAGKNIQYEVRDAFALINPVPAELVCAPYLLDMFAGDHLKTLLIRMGQSMEVGQQLLIISTLLFHTVGERNPQEIVQTLKASGFEIDYLDITRLPYTFSYYNYGARKETWNTFILKATKRRQTHSRNLKLLTDAAKLGPVDEDASLGEDVHVTWQDRKMILSRKHFNVFQRLLSCDNYSDLQASFAGEMTAEEFEYAIGSLTSRSLLTLAHGY
jgi:hypothetical protein